METITLKLTNEEISKLKKSFNDEIIDNKNEYVLFQIKTENCTITAYKSNKVVFQGKDANIYASSFKNDNFIEQAGSDEVGTGDFFGPVVVCACTILKNNIPILEKLDVKDSKDITDEKIIEIAPKLMEEIKYSLLILDNEKYNIVHKNNNMNAIKAKLHNKALVNLNNKHKLPKFVIIDQFTPKDLFYRYIKDEKEIIKNINFETKAENKYISVACASIIARYAFLKKWEEMEIKYNFKFIKGASNLVDKNIADFVKKYSEHELIKVSKIHFKNIEKYKEYM